MYVSNIFLFVCILACCGRVLPQKHCCLPDKYEIKCSLQSGAETAKGLVLTGGYIPTMAIDHTNNMVAVQELVFAGGQTYNISTIVDYNKHTSYMVYWDTKTCTKTPVLGKLSGKCIPPEATWAGRIHLGAGTPLLCDMWTMSKNSTKPPYNLGISFNTQTDSCTPVTEYIAGVKGSVVFETGLLFYNFTAGIKDASVFNIPAFCDEATLVETSDISVLAQALMLKFTD